MESAHDQAQQWEEHQLWICMLTHAEHCLQDDVLAEQMQQAADRAQKWKGRCAKLRQELMETQTAAASLEAALNVSQYSHHCFGMHPTQVYGQSCYDHRFLWPCHLHWEVSGCDQCHYVQPQPRVPMLWVHPQDR